MRGLAMRGLAMRGLAMRGLALRGLAMCAALRAERRWLEARTPSAASAVFTSLRSASLSPFASPRPSETAPDPMPPARTTPRARAASQSPVFRIFFVAVWSTILLGLIAGLAFVPVMLSYIGPLDDVPAPSRVGSRSDLRPLGASRTPSRSPFSAKAATRVSSRHELSFKPSFSGVEQLSPPHALAHGGAPCHALGAADIARTPGGGTGAPLPSVDRADPTHGTFGVAHPPVLSMSAGAEPSVGYPTSIARCEPLARTTVVDGAPGADGFRRPLPHAASAPRLHLPQ